MKKINVVYCGTPDFSVPTLELLNNHPLVNVKYVITMPDRPAGRGQKLQSPPVAQYAKDNGIPLFQTENINKEADFLNTLENEDIDCFVVLAFAQFLGNKILSLPKLGCFNIHTSLLPRFRGAAPIQYALLNGDTSTGVSIQKMVKKMDAGDLAISHPVQIFDYENGGLLYTRLKFQAALSCSDLIDAIVNNSIKYTTQNEDEVCFAPTLKKEDGFLNFKEQTYNEINNKLRALDPWPGCYCFLGKKRMKVFEIEEAATKLAPGESSFYYDHICVGCIDKTIRLKVIQLEGKKKCSDTELSNGLKNSPGPHIINEGL